MPLSEMQTRAERHHCGSRPINKRRGREGVEGKLFSGTGGDASFVFWIAVDPGKVTPARDRALKHIESLQLDGGVVGNGHHSGNFILRSRARYCGSPRSARKAGSDFTLVRSFALAVKARLSQSNARAELPEKPYALATT